MKKPEGGIAVTCQHCGRDVFVDHRQIASLMPSGGGWAGLACPRFRGGCGTFLSYEAVRAAMVDAAPRLIAETATKLSERIGRACSKRTPVSLSWDDSFALMAALNAGATLAMLREPNPESR